jgi:hypothetical protein
MRKNRGELRAPRRGDLSPKSAFRKLRPSSERFHHRPRMLGKRISHERQKSRLIQVPAICRTSPLEHDGAIFGTLPSQRIAAEQYVVALVGPFVAVLWAIVHQQQHMRIADAIGEQIEQRLGLLVDPVQVFEDYG